MSWYGVLTDIGKTTIENFLVSGVEMNLNVAKLGTGTVPSADMRARTSLVNEVGTGDIVGKSGTNNGALVQVSISPANDRFILKEIGLFVTLADESEVMVAYYNNTDGVEIPDVDDFPDFNYTVYCLLDLINSSDLAVEISTNAYLTSQNIKNDLEAESTDEGYALDYRQGKALDDKKANRMSPVFTQSLSLNRKPNTDDPYGSATLGYGNEASAYCASAFGYGNKAIGQYSHVHGTYNVPDSVPPLWVSGQQYEVGDLVYAEWQIAPGRPVSHAVFECIVANNDTEIPFWNTEKWEQVSKLKWAEIVGNGEDEVSRSNARALDWDGNEYLAGDLLLDCNDDSSGGVSVRDFIGSLDGFKFRHLFNSLSDFISFVHNDMATDDISVVSLAGSVVQEINPNYTASTGLPCIVRRFSNNYAIMLVYHHSMMFTALLAHNETAAVTIVNEYAKKSDLEPVDITNDISFTNATSVGGNVYKIGRMIFAQLRIKYSADTTGSLGTGFPEYEGNTNYVFFRGIDTSTAEEKSCYVNRNGYFMAGTNVTMLATHSYAFTFSYVCSS